MKKIFVILIMCVARIATAQEISPLVPYKPGKANHSIIEMEQKLNDNPSIVKNWGAVIERAAWRDGWAHEVSPEFFQEQKYILFCLRKSFQVKKNFQKGDFATFGTKSDGTLVSTERDPYSGELFLELDPNDLETESFRLSQDYPPFVYASSVCMNGVDVYAKQVSTSDVSPTPRLNRNNDGYSQVAPSTGGERYAESEFRETEETGNTYITNNYFSDEGEINYEQDEYGEYQDSRLSFWFSLNISAGPIYVNPYSNYGYVGNQPGYYNGNYSQPYVCIGHQGNNGVPSISNVSYFNQTVNNIYNYNYNYNYNSTTIITNPPPVPPVVGYPLDPPTGDIAYTPIDPANRTHAGFAKNKGITPIKGIKQVPANQNDGLAGNSIPRPMKPAGTDSRPKTNSSTTASTNSEQSIPRPMKPGATVDSRPKTNLNQGTAVADSRPGSRPNPSTGSVKPEPQPSQKPPNQFTRPVAQQDQYQANQTPQSRPATKQNQTQTNGSTQSRPQENRSNYKQNPRGSNPQPTQQSRQSYGNSSPSGQTAYNTGQSNRGSAPSGGRGNSGGGNYGGQRR